MWRRLGGSAASILVGSGMLVAGILVTGGGVGALLLRGWSGTTAVWLALLLLAGGAFIAFSCRLLMVGAYVSDHGLRVRTPLRTVTVGWHTILAVRTQKIIRAYNAVVEARQLCVDLVDGQTVELPIHGVRRGEPRSLRMPDILGAAEFDRLVAELRQLTAHYQTGGVRRATDR
jgi:hypothetical protein